MMQNKRKTSVYVVKTYLKQYEGGCGFEEDEWEDLPLLSMNLHQSYSTAKEQAMKSIYQQINPDYLDKIFGKSSPKPDEENEFLDEGVEQTLMDDDNQEQFEFELSREGNSIGPGCCVIDGFRFRTVIEKAVINP